MHLCAGRARCVCTRRVCPALPLVHATRAPHSHTCHARPLTRGHRTTSVPRSTAKARAPPPPPQSTCRLALPPYPSSPASFPPNGPLRLQRTGGFGGAHNRHVSRPTRGPRGSFAGPAHPSPWQSDRPLSTDSVRQFGRILDRGSIKHQGVIRVRVQLYLIVHHSCQALPS